MYNDTDLTEAFGDDYTPDSDGDSVNEDAADPQSDEGTTADGTRADGEAAATEAADDNSGDDSSGNTSGDKQNKQSAELNARYAAARRDAERQRDEAIAAEKERSKAELDGLIKTLELVNPYKNNSPVTNKAEYDELMKFKANEKKSAFMEANGFDDAQYQTFIDSLPEVKEAAEIKAKARAELEKNQAESAKSYLASELSEIAKYDTSVKNFTDLQKHSCFEELNKLCEKGYRISDAFRLLTENERFENLKKSERQSVYNSQSSKAHMSVSGNPHGVGIDSVPADVYAEYKMIRPDMTDNQIVQHWTKFKKNCG